jgi:hypothetical protein
MPMPLPISPLLPKYGSTVDQQSARICQIGLGSRGCAISLHRASAAESRDSSKFVSTPPSPSPCSLLGCSAALIARLGVGWWQRVTMGAYGSCIGGRCSQQQRAPWKKEIMACPSVTVVRCVMDDGAGVVFRIGPCMG